MSAPIKTSYDRTILKMATEGASSVEVVKATGRSFDQIRNRAMHLGVWHDLVRRTRDKQIARRAARPGPKVKTTGYQGSRYVAAVPRARVDHSTTDLLHTLRAVRRYADPTTPVPDSFIARVFEAGLTLDDIDAEFGVPPAHAVAAIRHHLGGDSGVTLAVR